MARIFTVQFDYEEKFIYQKLLKVFQYSVAKNCPGMKFEVAKIEAPEINLSRHDHFITKNHVKLKVWRDAILSSDEDTLLMDCDMLALKDLSLIFTEDFDVMWTRRTAPSKRKPFNLNAGMIAIKPNARSRFFISKWAEVDEEMYEDQVFHQIWRDKYAGMNQASLGWMLENTVGIADIISLPCRKWNICQEDWTKIDGESACVHIKSKLRRACSKESSEFAEQYGLLNAYNLWTKYFKEMETNEIT